MAVLLALTNTVSAFMPATDREECRVHVQVSCQILFTFKSHMLPLVHFHQSINVINLTSQPTLLEEFVYIIIPAREFLFAPLLQGVYVV